MSPGVTERSLFKGVVPVNTNLVLIGVFVVLLVLYMAKRRSRLNKD